MLTFTYAALLGGILAYGADFDSIQGLQSQVNFLYGAMMLVLLLPYVSISLYTNDKRIYLADASAKRYCPSAYYCAKVGVDECCTSAELSADNSQGLSLPGCCTILQLRAGLPWHRATSLWQCICLRARR